MTFPKLDSLWVLLIDLKEIQNNTKALFILQVFRESAPV